VPKLWLTYAWLDNEDGQADFLAGELTLAGVEVRLDRWTLTAGLSLWDQIKAEIADPARSDAWAIYATPNSLRSEPCIKEILFAVDRAKNARGKTFPVINVFDVNIDPEIIPPLLQQDIYVALSDHDWKERIVAATEARQPNIPGLRLDAFHAHLHLDPQNPKRHVLEVRPRVGTWCPFVAAIPIEEKDEVKLALVHGARGRPAPYGIMYCTKEGVSEDGKWWFLGAGNEATPTQSYYISFEKPPSRIRFGPEYEEPWFEVNGFH
jgi:hypothetical protein